MPAKATCAATSKLIDEFAQLDKAIAGMKPHIARHAALRAELLAIAAGKDADPADALVVENERYVLAWTPQEKQRRIVDLGKVKKRLGLPLFMKLVSMTLKALDAHVTDAEQRLLGLTVTERTGPRGYSVVPKLPPVQLRDILFEDRID